MIIEAKIKPNSKRFKVKKTKIGLEIELKSPPEGNKANRELIKELSMIYGSCRIKKGLKSKKKILELPDTFK